jgi:hypothetical protein
LVLPAGTDLTAMSREALLELHDSDHENRRFQGVVPTTIQSYDWGTEVGTGRWEYTQVIQLGRRVWKPKWVILSRTERGPPKVTPPVTPPAPKPDKTPWSWPNVKLPWNWPDL